jgi:hypothetical protein
MISNTISSTFDNAFIVQLPFIFLCILKEKAVLIKNDIAYWEKGE